MLIMVSLPEMSDAMLCESQGSFGRYGLKVDPPQFYYLVVFEELIGHGRDEGRLCGIVIRRT
jgi:hypothetical protein